METLKRREEEEPMSCPAAPGEAAGAMGSTRLVLSGHTSKQTASIGFKFLDLDAFLF